MFPTQDYKMRLQTRKPWLSEGLKRSIQAKNKLYYRKQKYKRLEHEAIYKKGTNWINSYTWPRENITNNVLTFWGK